MRGIRTNVNGAKIVDLRREGKTFPEIAEMTGASEQIAYLRVKELAPELIGTVKSIRRPKPEPEADERATYDAVLYNLKPRPIPAWKHPKTGSASGFIRPIPLSRLTGAKA